MKESELPLEGVPEHRSATGIEQERLIRQALEHFCLNIDVTGGVIGVGGGVYAPEGDHDWVDLADTYLLACRALGRTPKIQEDEDAEDEERSAAL